VFPDLMMAGAPPLSQLREADTSRTRGKPSIAAFMRFFMAAAPTAYFNDGFVEFAPSEFGRQLDR
jgi:hypothetical protein